MKGNEKVRLATGVCIFILALCPAGIARTIYIDYEIGEFQCKRVDKSKSMAY